MARRLCNGCTPSSPNCRPRGLHIVHGPGSNAPFIPAQAGIKTLCAAPGSPLSRGRTEMALGRTERPFYACPLPRITGEDDCGFSSLPPRQKALDPAIHAALPPRPTRMDRRIKPGGDEEGWPGACSMSARHHPLSAGPRGCTSCTDPAPMLRSFPRKRESRLFGVPGSPLSRGRTERALGRTERALGRTERLFYACPLPHARSQARAG